jgi:hypothetical protein
MVFLAGESERKVSLHLSQNAEFFWKSRQSAELFLRWNQGTEFFWQVSQSADLFLQRSQSTLS